jgi:hypothetical protein
VLHDALVRAPGGVGEVDHAAGQEALDELRAQAQASGAGEGLRGSDAALGERLAGLRV